MADDNFGNTASEIGTEEYWQEAYAKEIANFSDHGDYGHVWFGESTQAKIVSYIAKHYQFGTLILEVGCGNGALLIELWKAGFKQLTGIDYVSEAIELAQLVARKEQAGVTLEQNDLLACNVGCLASRDYEIVVDKGTFDAIGLCPTQSAAKRSKYIQNVRQLLRQDGTLVVSSCNYTKDELEAQFREKFALMEQIPTKTFSFGGKTGSNCTTVVFKAK